MAELNAVVGIVGWRNSGKTTLVADLVEYLTARGFRVSTIKHAHHGFDIDKPGKDSFQHREAGAGEVMIVSDNRWALMRELRGAPRPTLAELIARMNEADIILAEGFKTGHHPKIEVWRDQETELLARKDPEIIAIVAPKGASISGCACPVIERNDTGRLASLVVATCGSPSPNQNDRMRKTEPAGPDSAR